MRHKRQGFTLIELLIVVLIVVILSAMFMLAGGEAQSMAKATKIVNGLTDIKMAVLTWYRNNTGKIDKDGKINGKAPEDFFTTAKIKKYLNAASNFAMGSSSGCYQVVLKQNNKSKPAWYACYYLEDSSDKNDIKNKLMDKAAAFENNLFQGDSKSWTKYTDADQIYMPVLVFNY